VIPRQLPGYRHDLPFSYALGFFAAVELLRHRPQDARRVVLHRKLAAERRRTLTERCRALGVDLVEDDATIERLAHKGSVYALALFAKRSEELDPAASHLLLVRPSHFGNVGTTLRTMLAFGLRDLSLIDPQVDSDSPHVIRASLGARFAVRCRTYDRFADYRARFERPLYALSADAVVPLEEVRFDPPFTLALGPEWSGLPDEVRAAGTPLRIRQGDLVESLNLAVAAGIALHHATRPR
jgi:TrmH family RNA methyltransferase